MCHLVEEKHVLQSISRSFIVDVSYLIVYVSIVVEESIAIVVHDHRIDCFGIVLDDRRVSRPRRISRGIDTDYRTTSLVIALFLVFDLRRSSRARINDDRFSRTR